MEYLIGKPVAELIKKQLKEKINNKKRSPLLQILLNYEDESSVGYCNMIKKTSEEVGIKVEVILIKSKQEYIDKIKIINEDKNIDACLITRPLLKNCNENEIISLLDANKDADAINHQSLGKILYGNEKFVPNTSKAIIKLLEYNNINLEGEKVLVIGRSLSVGKPVSLLLLNRNATVTIAHSKTKDLMLELKNYDIIIVCIGKQHFIDGKFAKEGAIIIDAGIHYLSDKIIGDVIPSDNLSFISKVPGGVGVITTCCLLETVLSCYEENTNDF